jgi:hypothetical protein
VLDEALQFFKSHRLPCSQFDPNPQKGEHPVLSPQLLRVLVPSKTRSVGLPLVTNGTPVGRDSFHVSVYWDDFFRLAPDPEYGV